MIRQHPSEATLLAHAAGTLWEAAALLVGAHLAHCAHCSATVRLAEAVGGALLDGLPPMPLDPDALRRTLDRLDEANGGAAQDHPPASLQASAGLRSWPAWAPLEVRDARLRWLVPGVRHAVLLRRPGAGTLRLLQASPGTALPRHSHRGAELTLVLEGAFIDETGRYGPGDLAEVEEEVSHRPIAEGPADCVCLIASQGRLRFGALLGRLFGALARI